MSTMKRSISLLLVLGILLGVLAPAAHATPVEETATVDTGDVTIEGTNGFGSLLAQEVTENQQETEIKNENYPGGYSVTDLEIADGVATVTYDSVEDATLVVALHTEDGMQLLTSATLTVTPDATEATVTFEGEMPEYFMASAYLLDQYDYSPLCASYDTPMYTREMQELLASTVDDYDLEKVLNLDGDKTTNFAVYADSTSVIEPEDGVNTVATIDDENAVYVIENADEQITSLAEGDVFVYPYAENEILIIKVASISLDGTTATITGAELEMNDVFSYVKIESTADAGNAVVHDGTGDDCVTYNGVQYNSAKMNGQESQLQPNAWGDDITLPMPSLEFGVEETFEDAEGNKITISGGMKIEADINLQYYIALFSQYVKFQIDTTAGLNFTVAGTVELFEFELHEIDFDLIPQLVSVGSKPQVEVSFNGEIGWEGNVHFTVGFALGHNVPKQDLCTGPWVESKTNLKVGFAVKIDLQPNLSAKATDFLELISARVTCPAGFEVTAEENGQSVVDAYGDQGSSIHTCQNCLKFELFGCVELGAEIVFLDNVKLVNKGDGLSISLPFKAKVKVPILSAYYSATYNDFGFGSCPYESYRVTLEVLDSADQPVQDTPVYTKRESWGNTNKHGILATYVPEGTYELYTNIEEKEISFTIRVNGPDHLQITPNEVIGDGNPGIDNILDDILHGEDDFIDSPINPHVYLEDMPITNSARYTGNEGDSFIKKLGTRNGNIDIHGNAMEHGLEAWIARWNYTREISWAWVEYDLMKQYAFLSGKLTIVSDCYNRSSFNSTIEIIGDGNILYSSLMLPGMDAIPINVDVHGIETLRIYVYDNESAKGGTSFGLWDFGLTYSSDDYSENSNTSVEVNAVYPGMNNTEIIDTYALKTANFKNLVPGEEYVLLAMASIEAVDPLAADNLLAIDQGVASEDGTLSFQYIQRIPCDVSYVFVCGASDKNLNDAEITFPEMVADGELQVVDPTVIYDGKTLTEGRDYVILGKVDFTEAGEYTCYIRGIRNYTGSVECIYTVAKAVLVNPFIDVPEGSFYYEPVMWAIENGITNGTSATTFGPNDQCMRAHVVTFLWRAVGSPEPTRTDNPFVDVKPSDFYYKPVLWALENGITSGMDATHFGPTAYCNRAQVVTFLYRTMGRPELESAENPFTDVAKGSFYEKPVLWAVKNGITNGLSATTFGPNAICNRAQIVTFLYRAFVD